MTDRILALDLATKTGWAYWSGRSLHSGVWNLAAKTSPKRLHKLHTKLVSTVLQSGVDAIAVECAAGGKRGAAARILPELGGIVQLVASQHNLVYLETYPTALKKFATGSGKASKEEMIAAARKFWPHQDITVHDQADALCLLRWAVEEL